MDSHVYVAEWELRILDADGNIASQFEGFERRFEAIVTAKREVAPGQRFQIIAWGEDGSEWIADDVVRPGLAS